jgi:hypothetical protein
MHSICMCFLTLAQRYSFSSYQLKANMWSSLMGEKNATHDMYFAKLRDGSKSHKFLKRLENGF